MGGDRIEFVTIYATSVFSKLNWSQIMSRSTANVSFYLDMLFAISAASTIGAGKNSNPVPAVLMAIIPLVLL